MPQIGGDLDLGQKAIGAEHRAELRLEHLDRDVAVVLQVVREVDGRHAAGAELPLDAVARAKGGLQTVQEVRHSGEDGRAGRPRM